LVAPVVQVVVQQFFGLALVIMHRVGFLLNHKEVLAEALILAVKDIVAVVAEELLVLEVMQHVEVD
jgi:hypothetical protein